MNKDKLIQAGVNYYDGVERFGGAAAVYEKYLAKFFEGGYMDNIQRQLEAGDIAGAFRTAHDLKSLVGNLSINHCYDAICALTEKLRKQEAGVDCQNEWIQVKQWYDKAKNAAADTEQ